MPGLSDIPGQSLFGSGGRRAGKLAVAGAVAAIAVSGYLVRRLRRRGGDKEEETATTDPIAETRTAPLGASREAPPPVRPKAKPSKPEPAKPQPPRPEAEPGDRSKDADPHHALNNPVEDPDPTEWPDPYEKRADPLDPADPDGEPFGEEPHVTPGAESTSQPHPDQDIEAGDRAQPPKREKLDD